MEHRLIALCLLTLSTSLGAQIAPRLLVDVDPTPMSGASSSDPDSFARLGGWTFFAADDGVHGRELFRTAGRPGTTTLFAELRAGPLGADPYGMTAAGSRLFFFADDGVHGSEPWVSDGTPAGTRMIVELVPGPVTRAEGIQFYASASFGRRFLFTLWELDRVGAYVTDGTAAGTELILEVTKADQERPYLSVVSAVAVERGTGLEPVLLFIANDSTALVWWQTDGTASGTTRLLSIPPRALLRAQVGLPGKSCLLLVHFDAQGRSTFAEFWRSDGTVNGTIAYHTMPAWSWFPNGAGFDGRAWFTGGSGHAAVVTDGTAAGTRAIPLSRVGTVTGIERFLGTVNGSLRAIGGVASSVVEFFRIDPGASDPVLYGTTPVRRDAFTYLGPGVGSRFLFVDQSDAVTVLDADLAAFSELGIATGRSSHLGARWADGLGRVLFAMNDPLRGVELGVTDGTTAGTQVLDDLNLVPIPTADSQPRGFRSFGRHTAFMAWQGDAGGVWATDGTATGTRRLLADLYQFSPFAVWGDRLIFGTQARNGEWGLWVTDGSVSGTLSLGPDREVRTWWPLGAVALGDRAIVVHAGDGRAPGLWGRVWLASTDGVTSIDLANVRDSNLLAEPVRVGDLAVFMLAEWWQHADGDNAAVWVSDGTPSGTRRVVGTRFSWGYGGGREPGLMVFRDRVYFVGVGLGGEQELWVCDGTAAGTRRVGLLSGDTGSDRMTAAAILRERIILTGPLSTWSSDGTTAGTRRLSMTIPLPEQTNRLAVAGDVVVFDGQLPGTTSHVPFVTDGTDAGTRPLAGNLLRGWPPRENYISDGRQVMFGAYDMSVGARGSYISDGTSTGTRRVADLSFSGGQWGGYHSREWQDHTLSNGLLYLGLFDSRAGIEPHVIDVGASVQRLASGCGGSMRQVELFASLGGSAQGGLELVGHATSGSAAWLVMSPPPMRPRLMPQAGACVLEVDAAALVTLGLLPISNGRFARSFALPDDPALHGLQAAVQAIVGPTNGRLGIDLSNGLLLTIGR